MNGNNVKVVRDETLPFGGAHAPSCPYRHPGGECLCWRSDPWQNPDIEDAARDRARDSVAIAMGYVVPDARIVEAIVAAGTATDEDLELDLSARESVFKEAGGRGGSGLANRIGLLQIALAVRNADRMDKRLDSFIDLVHRS